ncbi:MAG: hypothetical protein QM790_01080 [Nibricoccus sp.]
MKISSYLLSASLVGNFVLAALAFHQSNTSTAPSRGSASPNDVLANAHAGRDDSTNSLGKSPAQRLLWTQLYSDDPVEFVRRLRAAGFPRELVRLLANNLIDRKQETKRTAILGRREDTPYWRPVSYGSDDPEKERQLMQLYAEESKLTRKLFPERDTFDDDPEYASHVRKSFGNFSTEKLQRLMTISDDYMELREDIYTQRQSRGELSAAEREKLAMLVIEEQRDIQQALSPEEYAEYELRNSSTANRLRRDLQLFQPTEAEYKTLFAILHPVDQQFTPYASDEATRSRYRETMKALAPQIEAALGSERYADYVQATENGSDKLNRLMARLNLPLSTAGKVTAIRQEITERAKAVRGDQSLEPAARAAQLSTLAEEAKTKLSSTLGGARGYEAYEDVKGDWIRALKSANVAK